VGLLPDQIEGVGNALTDTSLSDSGRELPTASSRTGVSVFDHDGAITGRKEDRLGRADFADGIASAIRGWTGKESLTVALFGPYGSGKTSVKEMILEALRLGGGGSHVIQLNVWQFSHREHLTASLLDQIGIELDRGTLLTESIRGRLVKRWRTYAAYLASAGSLVGLVRSGIAGVVALLGSATLLLGFTIAPPTAFVVAGLVFLGIAAALRWAGRVTDAVADMLAIRSTTAKRSLAEVRADLHESLRGLTKPVLVVLDDVDRLTPSETVELFQFVKANADFPNLIYLLLTDRATAERHVVETLRVDGRQFLEKVVQVAFDVPAIVPAQLAGVLTEGLNHLLADDSVSKRFSQNRWGSFFEHIAPFFQNIRQVRRYLSTLSFHAGVFRRGETFEVNPIDLIVLEALRVFEPEVYSAVAGAKDVLVNTHPWDDEKESRERRVSAFRVLVSLASERHRTHVEQLLIKLFPKIRAAVQDSQAGDEEAWLRDLRVCAPELFHRYFALALPEGDISQQAIERVIRLSGDRTSLRAELELHSRAGTLDELLNRLEAYKELFPVQNSLGFITALLDIGDEVDDEGGFFSFSPRMRVHRLIHWHLRQLKSSSDRLEVLETAIRNARGLGLAVQVVKSAESALKKKPAIEGNWVDPADLEKLKAALLERIRAAAESGELLRRPDAANILFRWHEWAGPDEVKQYLSGALGGPREWMHFIRAFVTKSFQQGMNDSAPEVKQFIRLSEPEIFVELDSLMKVVADLGRTNLGAEDRLALELLEEAWNRRASGKPDFGGGDFDDD
jgi:predicted KAP-like P-loop ATPase